MIVFDDACKRVESKARQDEDELKTAYNQMQVGQSSSLAHGVPLG